MMDPYAGTIALKGYAEITGIDGDFWDSGFG